MTDFLYITEDNYKKLIEDNKGLIVIDFWALWCGPCKRLSPILEKVSKNYENKVLFAKINVDECPNIIKKYAIMTIPTVIFIDNGMVITKEIGVKSEAVYKSHLEHLINNRGL